MIFTLYVEDLPPGESDVHLHLGVGAMSAVNKAFNLLGMISHSSPLPDWPEPERFGITEAEAERYADTDPSEAPAPVSAFLAALCEVTDAAAERPDGIPCYKLTSNLGWLVTPDEISAALGWWAAAGCAARERATSGLSWWPSLITFLKRARDHGGFRVE